MATKEGFPKSREDLQSQTTALLFGISGNHTRTEVMEDLQALFNYCYEFGLNPLPRIRKCFPSLRWVYFSLGEALDAERFIADRANFVWRIYFGGFITATMYDQNNKDPDIYFLLNNHEHHVGRSVFRLMDVVTQ